MKDEGPLTAEIVDGLIAKAEPLTMGSDPGRLLELSQRACDFARRLSYAKGEAYARTYLGFARWYSGELEKAHEDLKTSLALFQSMGDAVGLAKARVALLSVQKSLGIYDQSLEHNLACLKFFRETGDRIWEGACLLALGSLHYDTGDVQKSMQHYQEAAGVADTVPDPQRAWMLGRALVGIGSAYERLGEHERALEHYAKSLPLFESAGNAMGEARVLNDIGVVHQHLGRDESAVDFHKRSLAIRRRIGQREAQISSLLNIGRLFVRLGRLVAGLAHELNNPIGALRSASRTASLCAEKLEGLLNLEENLSARAAVMTTRESAQVMAEATERMIALLERLKSFSRLDEAALQRTDVRTGIDSALELLRSELEGRVRVVKEYGDVPELTCYPGELNQVFMTLLTNAAEAIEEAGTIRIDVHQAGDMVRIQVSDDGRGIPPEKLDRLFDFDFSTGGPRVKMSSSLVTARNIVLKHRGDISVESHLGRGTRFTIELPVHVPTG